MRGIAADADQAYPSASDMTQQMPPLPPQQPFASIPMAQSPGVDSSGGLTLPSAKRQRLSPPDLPSPYMATPASYQTHSISPAQAPTPSPSLTPQTPQSYNLNFDGVKPTSGVMGPPSRPADKVERVDKSTDLNQLSDIVSASGIDVREEENYLAETYRNQQTNASSSNAFAFQPQSSASSRNNSNVWARPRLEGYGLPGAGPFNQAPVSMEIVEEDLMAKHKKAARALAEQQQQHLRDPFLEVNTVRHRLAKRANQQGVGLNLEGLYDRVVDPPRTVNGTTIQASNGTGIVAMQAPSILNENAPLVDLFTLISLATSERVRGLVEDAYGLARGRQYGTHGTVPPEWSSLAIGPGQPNATTAVSSSLTGTAWDRPLNGSDVGKANGVARKS